MGEIRAASDSGLVRLKENEKHRDKTSFDDPADKKAAVYSVRNIPPFFIQLSNVRSRAILNLLEALTV